jgi:hypothetical protein
VIGLAQIFFQGGKPGRVRGEGSVTGDGLTVVDLTLVTDYSLPYDHNHEGVSPLCPLWRSARKLG